MMGGDDYGPYGHRIEVKYEDRPFQEKRRILTKYFNEDPAAYRCIKLLAHKFSKNVNFELNILEDFLVCGHVAFCKLEGRFEKVPVDSITTTTVSGKMMWEYRSMTQKVLLSDEDVVYIAYNADSYADLSMSLLDQIYRKIIKVDDQEFLDYIVDKYTKSLNFSYDMLSTKGIRKHKLKKIL